MCEGSFHYSYQRAGLIIIYLAVFYTNIPNIQMKDKANPSSPKAFLPTHHYPKGCISCPPTGVSYIRNSSSFNLVLSLYSITPLLQHVAGNGEGGHKRGVVAHVRCGCSRSFLFSKNYAYIFMFISISAIFLHTWPRSQ